MTDYPRLNEDQIKQVTASPSWRIKLLYDGECPFCMREVNFLQKKDRGRGLVAFVDISQDSYDPSEHGGVDFEAAMGRIHAILADGTVVRDLEVFRQVYKTLGMGWIYAPTKWAAIAPIANKLYQIWASWRLRMTGRPRLETIVSQRQVRRACQQDRCRRDG